MCPGVPVKPFTQREKVVPAGRDRTAHFPGCQRAGNPQNFARRESPGEPEKLHDPAPRARTSDDAERLMSKFTFEIVNNRGDDSQLNLLLTATNDDTGLEGIELGTSTSVKAFFDRNP